MSAYYFSCENGVLKLKTGRLTYCRLSFALLQKYFSKEIWQALNWAPILFLCIISSVGQRKQWYCFRTKTSSVHRAASEGSFWKWNGPTCSSRTLIPGQADLIAQLLWCTVCYCIWLFLVGWVPCRLFIEKAHVSTVGFLGCGLCLLRSNVAVLVSNTVSSLWECWSKNYTQICELKSNTCSLLLPPYFDISNFFLSVQHLCSLSNRLFYSSVHWHSSQLLHTKGEINM